jgi:hypothetical protein
MADERPADELLAHAVPTDVLSAKRLASERWLRVAAHQALRPGPSLRVAEAVALAPQNVHAVGVGRKIVEGVVSDVLSVRFYVVQKLAMSLLGPESRIPETIEGVPTDVIESAPAFIAQGLSSCSSDRRSKQRPAPAGISVAHRDVTAGTIACYCRSTYDGEGDEIFLLSNNHVLANLDEAQVGDDVLQPGRADGGTAAADRLAVLHRSVPITAGGTTPNAVDAAIARVLDAESFEASICSIGRVGGTLPATEEMRVRKHGRTTGLTEGVVADVSYDALVGMSHLDPNLIALFADQIRIDVAPPYPAFGLSGDSGSLVVAGWGRHAVGLDFAGPPSGDYGVANPIEGVLSALGITLL